MAGLRRASGRPGPGKPGGNRGIGELEICAVCGGRTGNWIDEPLDTCCEFGAITEKEPSDVGSEIKTSFDSSIVAGRL